MSEPTRLDDLAENQGHHAELRAYERRLGEWLGLNVDEVLDLNETKTSDTTPIDPLGLRVAWSAAAEQRPSRGSVEGPGRVVVGEEGKGQVRYFGSVYLDFEELGEMRADVGEPPVDKALLAPVRRAHRLNDRTGNCSCGWEPSSNKGTEREHERHIQRVLEGIEPPAGKRGWL